MKNNNDRQKGQDEYSRSLFGEIVARFKRNRLGKMALSLLLLLFLIAIGTLICDLVTGDRFYEDHVIAQDLKNKLQSPNLDSIENIFGRDEYGRSIFFRVLWGTRYSLFLGVAVILVATALGGLLGSIAGFYGGWLDILLMRILDIYQSVPMFLLCVTLAAILGASLTNAIIAIGISNVPVYARITRATVLTVRQSEYVEAARAIDASTRRTIFVHILPNCLAPIIVEVTMGIASAVLAGAALSFIGLGVQPPTPEWGAMVSEGRNFMRQHPTIALYPGLCIMATVLSFNLLGDGLRDALDPRLKN